MMFSQGESDVVHKAISLYFSVFKNVLEKSGDGNQRIVSALLTGINRAFPFAPGLYINCFVFCLFYTFLQPKRNCILSK